MATAAAEQNAKENQDPDPFIVVKKVTEASHIVFLSLNRDDAALLGFPYSAVSDTASRLLSCSGIIICVYTGKVTNT